MKIAIGTDHAGVVLKGDIKALLESMEDITVEDMGCHDVNSVDYPDYAERVCRAIIDGECERGILICGTGIGMSIAANKLPGIRAALCHDTFSARATREHNDSNVLCLGQRVIGPGLAQEVVKTWLGATFAGGKHARRVDKISLLEQA